MRSGGVLKLTVTACAALAAAIAVGAALTGHLSLGIGVGTGLLLGSLNGYVLQANYLPLNKGTGPAFWPRSNVKLSLQYVIYNRFDGSKSNGL